VNSHSKLRLLRIPTSRISRLFCSKSDLQKKFISVKKEIQTSSIFLVYSELKLVETCNNPPLPRTLQPWSEYVILLRTDSSKILQVSDYYILITMKFRLVRLLRIFTAPPPPQMLLLPPLLSCMVPRLPPLPLACVPSKKKEKYTCNLSTYTYLYVYIMQGASFVAPITCFFVRIQHKFKCTYIVYICVYVYIYIHVMHGASLTFHHYHSLERMCLKKIQVHMYIYTYISAYIYHARHLSVLHCVALCCSVLQGIYIYIYTHTYLNIHVMRGSAAPRPPRLSSALIYTQKYTTLFLTYINFLTLYK